MNTQSKIKKYFFISFLLNALCIICFVVSFVCVIFTIVCPHFSKLSTINFKLSDNDFVIKGNEEKSNDILYKDAYIQIISQNNQVTKFKMEKIKPKNNGILEFINPVLYKTISNVECEFSTIYALYNEKEDDLIIKNKIIMICPNTNNYGYINELYGNINSGFFYGNKGLNLLFNGTRYSSENYIIENGGKIIKLKKNTVIKEYTDNMATREEFVISTDKLVYKQDDGVAELYRYVKMTNQNEIVSGDNGKCFFTKEEKETKIDYILINDNTSYVNKEEDLFVYGDKMRYYKTYSIIDVEGNVVIKNNKMISKAPYFAYDYATSTGKFITTKEYNGLKKRYIEFNGDIAKYVIYTNNINTDLIKLSAIWRREQIEEKSRIRIKTK